ncbi:MAG: RHS repeat-associated core domain-containing protein [Chloroflexi bacterium]|nr:RHS repeat-associated core domain-containing protein [Chloroflexota bacterium]
MNYWVGNIFLSESINTYTYDLANRLTAFDDGENVYYYAYNGLGDRLQQTVNYTTTTYAVDIAGGLTQVLSDGTNTYLYGVDRISQQHGSLTEYYLADALGSVRQLTNFTGEVVLARAYDPYGNLVENNAYDGVTTVYGYAGEYTDTSGMVYLRARYYSPVQGRFVSRDVWEGDYNNPLSLNKWGYVEGNPINYTDPSGLWRWRMSSDPIYHT